MDITSNIPLILLAGSIIAAWSALLPRFVLWGLFASLVAGQVVRAPLPHQGGGVLLSDVAVIFVLLSALILLIRRREKIDLTVSRVLLLSVTPFILWSLFTLVIRTGDLLSRDLLVASLYWARTTCYLLLLPAINVLVVGGGARVHLLRGFLVTLAALVVLGFLQLGVFWDLSTLSSYGWDPHQGRMVSTWLDPNFFGAFLAITFPVLFVCFRKKHVLLLAGLAIAALLATESRSSFVALGAALAILVPAALVDFGRKYEKDVVLLGMAVAISSIVLVTGVAGALLGDRLVGFVQPYEPTVVLRTNALKVAWDRIIVPNSLTGVGYNAYQFAAVEAGLIGDFSIHSRAGADNSWLTLWATTGIVGVFLFAMPWAMCVLLLVRRARKEGGRLSIAAIASLLALFVHSQLVNSFLYAHLLIVLAIVVAMGLLGFKEKYV